MAKNNKLKRRAHDLMARIDGLSYMDALHAVDEPLHGLRDLTLWPLNRCAITRGHFRLVGEDGIHSPAFERPTRGHGYWKLIEERGLDRFDSYDGSFFLESARRIQLLKDQGAKDIWDQRVLHRAGVLEGEILEPLFHHYAYRLSPEGGLTMIHGEGHRLGIYSVNISSTLEDRDERATLPITQRELKSLREGSLIEALQLPWGDWAVPATGAPRSLTWTASAHTLLSSKARTRVLPSADRGLPQVALLLGDGASSPEVELSSRGLSLEDFELTDVRGKELKYHLISELLHVHLDGELIFKHTTQNFVEIGEELLAARPELYS